MHFAVKQKNLKIIHFLIQNGADLMIRNKFNKYAIDIAIDNNEWKIAEYLAKIGNITKLNSIFEENEKNVKTLVLKEIEKDVEFDENEESSKKIERVEKKKEKLFKKNKFRSNFGRRIRKPVKIKNWRRKNKININKKREKTMSLKEKILLYLKRSLNNSMFFFKTQKGKIGNVLHKIIGVQIYF